VLGLTILTKGWYIPALSTDLSSANKYVHYLDYIAMSLATDQEMPSLAIQLVVNRAYMKRGESRHIAMAT